MEEVFKPEKETIPEFNRDTHKYDWKLKKVVELTPEELAEIARQKRKTDLDKRFSNLTKSDGIFFKAYPKNVVTMKDGSKHSISMIDELKKWNRDDLDDFEQKVLKLEAAKREIDDKEEQERPMLNRKNEYRKIDEMLLEGLAEQEEGRPQMLARYMTLRRAIKEKFPK